MSSHVLTTFRPNDGSYKTQTVIPENSSSSSSNNNNNNNSTNTRPTSRATPPISLVGALIGGCKGSPLLSCILGATLVASVFNTILLSFVIKSLQLHDRDLIDGKISWDEQTKGTLFELPTSLRPDKSISLNSIESHKDKPLRFLVGKKQQPANKSPSSVFLSADGSSSSSSSSDHHPSSQAALIDSRATAKSSYMAVSEPDKDESLLADQRDVYHHDRTLEMGAKVLRLSLIDTSTSNRNSNKGNEWQSHAATSKLLEFDDESRSLELPLERELRLYPEQTSSITLESAIVSDSIAGSNEESLRVQTREGNLVVKCRDSLEFVSKSAGAKLTTLETLSLKSPSVSISSDQGIYATNGIEYFDSEPEENGKRPTKDAAEIIAYDLHTVDGVLRAA